MAEHKKRVKELLHRLSAMVEGVYFVRYQQVWPIKNNMGHAERIKNVAGYWIDFFSKNPDAFNADPGVFLDFETYHWFMKFILPLAIAVRFQDDSNLFTISLILGEIAETIRKMLENNIYTLEIMDDENLIRLRYEFYEFLKSNLGTSIAVKYATSIYSLDQRSCPEDWEKLIDSVSREVRGIMGPFIARGINSSLNELVKKYFRVIKLRGEKNE